jgi:hypothetical protein
MPPRYQDANGFTDPQAEPFFGVSLRADVPAAADLFYQIQRYGAQLAAVVPDERTVRVVKSLLLDVQLLGHLLALLRGERRGCESPARCQG